MPRIQRIRFAAFLAAFAFLAAYSHAEDAGAGRISFASYNVENYLEMPRHVGGHLRSRSGKPETERIAVVSMIRDLSPDILGIMEIGDEPQIEDLIRRLKAAGMDYPHRETVQGGDSERHLLLLSRYPIIARHSLGDIPLSVKGMTLHSPRGLLDVTVQTPSGECFRVICVHLKARVGVPEYDEAALRQAEADFLGSRVRSILKDSSEAGLVVMGDFNATRNGTEWKKITGDVSHPGPLRMIPLTDDRGESWTEYWPTADIYSRIDYILTTPSLAERVDPSGSGVARPACWSQASDHCPVHITLTAPRKTNPSPSPTSSR